MGMKYRGVSWFSSDTIFEIGQEYVAANGETHIFAGVIHRDKIFRQHTPDGPEYIPESDWLVNENGDILFRVEPHDIKEEK